MSLPLPSFNLPSVKRSWQFHSSSLPSRRCTSCPPPPCSSPCDAHVALSRLVWGHPLGIWRDLSPQLEGTPHTQRKVRSPSAGLSPKLDFLQNPNPLNNFSCKCPPTHNSGVKKKPRGRRMTLQKIRTLHSHRGLPEKPPVAIASLQSPSLHITPECGSIYTLFWKRQRDAFGWQRDQRLPGEGRGWLQRGPRKYCLGCGDGNTNVHIDQSSQNWD